MKTEEDEAFDELSRKQGDWGGGFTAKRKMAADKLQDGKCKYCVDGCIACDARAQPAQEPVARVTGVYGGKFTYDPINRATILPVGMALYSAPPQREWVGLTDEEIKQCGFAVLFDGTKNWALRFVKAAEAKLKEKNNGT